MCFPFRNRPLHYCSQQVSSLNSRLTYLKKISSFSILRFLKANDLRTYIRTFQTYETSRSLSVTRQARKNDLSKEKPYHHYCYCYCYCYYFLLCIFALHLKEEHFANTLRWQDLLIRSTDAFCCYSLRYFH